MFVLFDVSANGKPKKWNVSPVDTFNWPRLVHAAWLVYNKKGDLIVDKSFYVKDMATQLTEETIRLNKIDLDEMENEGVPLIQILDEFAEDIQGSTYTFSFNDQFNSSVLRAEYYRESRESPLTGMESYCLMRESTYFCKIPGPDGRYKWPTLNQLHGKLYNVGYEQVGNAKYDLMALSRCFNKLLDLGELDDLF